MIHRRKTTVCTATACLLLGPASWLAAAEKGVKPRVEKLDNGLELRLVGRHEQPIRAGRVAHDVGSDFRTRSPHGHTM